MLRLRATIPAVCELTSLRSSVDLGRLRDGWQADIPLLVDCNGPWTVTVRPRNGVLANVDGHAAMAYRMSASVGGAGMLLHVAASEVGLCAAQGCVTEVGHPSSGTLNVSLFGEGSVLGLPAGRYREVISVEVFPMR